MTKMNERERIEEKAKQVKEEVLNLIGRLSPEEIFEMICAPEATDDLENIEFEDDDEEAERKFIEYWLREEREYNARAVGATEGMEAEDVEG
jgi:hypothetical protein